MTIEEYIKEMNDFCDKCDDMAEEIDVYTIHLPDGIYDLIDYGFEIKRSKVYSVDGIDFDPFYIIREYECGWLKNDPDHLIKVFEKGGKKIKDITASLKLSEDERKFLGECKNFNSTLKDLYDKADGKLDQIAGYIVDLYLKRSSDLIKTLKSNKSLVDAMTKLLQDHKRLHKNSMSDSIRYIHGILSLYETVYGVKPGSKTVDSSSSNAGEVMDEDGNFYKYEDVFNENMNTSIKYKHIKKDGSWSKFHDLYKTREYLRNYGHFKGEEHDPWKGKPVPTRCKSRPKPAEFHHTRPSLK